MVKLLEHQVILSKQYSDDIRVNESQTYGLNYVWNTLEHKHEGEGAVFGRMPNPIGHCQAQVSLRRGGEL